MVTRKTVLKVNAFVIILNWTKEEIWGKREIRESIVETLDTIREEEIYVPSDITIKECKNYLQALIKLYAENINALKKDITKERKTYVRPLIRSTAEFFRENELPFKTAEEYQAFLAVNVLPEITEAIYVY